MPKVQRHAYLVMAHHRKDVLLELLQALDDPRNDIFLHIDEKSDPEMHDIGWSPTHSRLQTIPPMKVYWGDYSQIACELELLEAAASREEYAYYHLMNGASYPLKSQDEIHELFLRNPDTEYVDISGPRFYERVRCIHVFTKVGKGYGKHANLSKKAIVYIRRFFVLLQKIVGYDHFVQFGMESKRGFVFWSITHSLAKHVLSQKELVHDMLKYSFAGDEFFMQTMAYNSPFRDMIFRNNRGEQVTDIWTSTWPIESRERVRTDHCFKKEDLEDIRISDKAFGMKFDGPDGMWLIQQLKERRK